MERDSLLIGWSVDELFEPVAWSTLGETDLTNLAPDHLVQIDPLTIGTHSCIIAQSGSGKSFFLGRLLEELLLATKAKLLIIDPNADFLRFYSVVDDSLWAPPTYDRTRRLGRLPTEPSSDGFKGFLHSEENSFCIVTEHDPPETLQRNVKHEKYRIQFGQLKESFLYDACLSYKEAQDLILTHQFALHILAIKIIAEGYDPKSDIEADWKIAHSFVGLNPDQLKAQLRAMAGSHGDESIEKAITGACSICDHVTNDSWILYDRLLTRYHSDEFLDSVVRIESNEPRIRVIDGTSASCKEYRDLMNAHVMRRTIELARKAWSDALSKPQAEDKRVPTFIVIDEAHNVAKRGECTESEARCREVVREIAAEGRKLGIFLILVSQRPDKLDPFIISEVGNIALMRLANLHILEEAINLFGLKEESSRTLEKVLQLPKSRALLLGKWAKNGPMFLMSAMRRTIEGGRDLNLDYWASRKDA